MIFGYVPFLDDERRPAEYKILEDPILFPAPKSPNTSILASGDCQDFITQLLEKNSYRRLGCRSSRDVIRHNWFNPKKDPDFVENVRSGKYTAPHLRTLNGDADLKYFTDHDEDNYEKKYRLLRHNPHAACYDWAKDF